jgi:integrator complex subunit 7
MTDHEHGQVSRLAGILLLGFLLPQSTGNDFFLLQNLSSRRASGVENSAGHGQHRQSTGAQTSEHLSESEDMGDYIIHMSLEERLESSCHRYSPDEYGEFHAISFEPLEFAFQAFLHNALGPFLRGRPCHTREVDLLHVLAMAIHPQPSEQSIRETASRLEQRNARPWRTARRLMASLVPHSFHLSYKHRLRLVEMVANCLVVPESLKGRGSYDDPLTEGALPHLRASLYAFGMAASSPYDSHMAQCGMVALAVQNGVDHVVREEWSRLLHRMVDDRTVYPVGQSMSDDSNFRRVGAPSQTLSSARVHSLRRTSHDACFCPHMARGELLRGFLARHSGARHFAEDGFLQYALASLTDAIEMQVDCWTRDEEEEEEKSDDNENATGDSTKSKADAKTSHPPRVLASLLYAAQNLFYFLLPMKNGEPASPDGHEREEVETESEESHRRDMLVSCGIQLVHHWDPSIVEEACKLLILAFSYADEMWEDYVGAVFESTKIAIDILIERTNNDASKAMQVPIEGLISAFSQRSNTFAGHLFRLLLKKKVSVEGRKAVLFWRLLAAVANACPGAAQEHRDVLMRELKDSEDPDSKTHIVAIVLACRRARYFASEDDSGTMSVTALGRWEMYLVARQALLTGNYKIAKDTYDLLINHASSEPSYIWLSALGQIAEGESSLAGVGARGLPDASTSLRSAMITLRFLSKLKGSQDSGVISVDFQMRWLGLRVSFLDLLTGIRQQTREMRLTGIGPRKQTRPHLHLKNLIKGIDRLGCQYEGLSRQFGLFSCQQTRSALRTLQVLCTFVADAARKVFSDSLPESEAHKRSHRIPKGDASQPLTSLMKQLQAIALNDMDTSVDTKIRAAAMLEILDGVLKVPVPVPRDLTTTKSIPRAKVQVVWDPDEYCDIGIHDNTYVMAIAANSSMSFLASGLIPESMLERTRLPFSVILLRLTIEPKGISVKSNTLSEDANDGTADDAAVEHSQPHGLNTTATSMSSSGTFFSKVRMVSPAQEGRYYISFQLGCRDIRGGEWDLPLCNDPPRFSVKIVRSNS